MHLIASLVLLVILVHIVAIFSLHPATRKAMKAVKNNHESSIRHCEVCGLTFTKPSEWDKHMAGRRHQTNLEKWVTPEAMYQEYLLSAPHWATSTSAASRKKTRDDYKQERRAEKLDSALAALPSTSLEAAQAESSRLSQLTLNVSRLWTNDELSTLQLRFRATCLHPSTMMRHLHPYQKCRVWRYLRDAMGVGHYTEVATIMAAVDAYIGEIAGSASDEDSDEEEEEDGRQTEGLEGQGNEAPALPHAASGGRDRYAAQHAIRGFLRIKEIFESFEAYRAICTFVLAAEKRGPVPRIVELGAGHGLVGILLAYRFPHIEVALYDRTRRGIFDIFLECWARHGQASPCLDSYAAAATVASGEQGSDTHAPYAARAVNAALPNIAFIEGDVSQADTAESLPAGSVVVCVHGCNEVNQLAIEMALRRGCAWVAMPCCIRRDMYLAATVLIENDDVRHSVMCGALASTYGAQFMGEIDRRITNRGIVIGGGVGAGVGGDVGVTAGTGATASGVPPKYRGNLPKLSLS